MNDALLIVGVIAVMGLVAGLVALTLGRRIARRSKALAILLSGLLPSVVLALVEISWFAIHADVHGDGPAMALVGSLIYAILALPVTTLIAVIVVIWSPSRRADPRNQ